jgi:G:T-mismatch repair DNA endonuclease (very short patch repair protein)
LRSDVVWHESVRLEPYERRIIDAIPVTEPARTLLDLASLDDELLLATVYDDFIRRGLTSVAALYARIGQLGELRRGTAAMRRLMKRRLSAAVPESSPETKFDQLVHRAGLPAPTPQYEVRDGDVLFARVDFAYPRSRILIEIQSTRWHDGQFEVRRDRRRHARLAALGYRVIPIGTDDLRDRPDEVVAQVRAALGIPA